MEIKTYFFDSYAFFEIIEGNPDYKLFIKDIAIVTTKLNLMELYYGLLIKYNKDIANKYFDLFIEYAIDIDNDVIKQSMIFRSLNKKKNLSYIDCIGYILSFDRNIRFLTGDEQFRDLPNVEFVK